ncbi:MAG: xylulokinase, partial [Planctomycetes bacterium]|nr:xylulokinase [Planctomycetota bacterium]
SVTIGTSGVVFAQGDRHIEHPTGLLHSFCHSVPNQWYLMGVMLSAGGSFQWLRDMYSSVGSMDYNKMTSLAEKSPIGCEGLIFLPYLTGERVPHDDPRARGGWVGLTQRHNAEHLTRSVMEGISYGLCDSLMLITELGLPIERIYASGGAVRSRLWLQMLADIFNKEIVTTSITEGAAYGAAILAGVGTKQYTSFLEATDELVKIADTFEPAASSASVYAEHYEQYRLLYPALKESFSNLSELANKYSGA